MSTRTIFEMFINYPYSHHVTSNRRGRSRAGSKLMINSSSLRPLHQTPCIVYNLCLIRVAVIFTVNMASIAGLQSLSARGESIVKSIPPVFLDVISDSFSADSNPTGFISLGLAENVRTTIYTKSWTAMSAA